MACNWCHLPPALPKALTEPARFASHAFTSHDGIAGGNDQSRAFRSIAVVLIFALANPSRRYDSSFNQASLSLKHELQGSVDRNRYVFKRLRNHDVSSFAIRGGYQCLVDLASRLSADLCVFSLLSILLSCSPVGLYPFGLRGPSPFRYLAVSYCTSASSPVNFDIFRVMRLATSFLSPRWPQQP